jgi:aspartate dehydrogenase
LNTHEIAWEGASGKCRVVLENLPSPDNPKTSYLAALSVLYTLKKMKASYKVGS